MLYSETEAAIDREDFDHIECRSKQGTGFVEERRCTDNVSTPHIDSESWIRDPFIRDPSLNHVTYPGHSLTWSN
jgi:hypothetical protein